MRYTTPKTFLRNQRLFWNKKGVMRWIKGVNMGKMISKNKKYAKVDKHMKISVIGEKT